MLYHEPEVASTDVQPSFTNEDAYTGGAALRLKGVNNATATDVVLFKTNLTPSKGKVVAKVAIKTGKEGNNDSKLSLIVRVNGAWKAYALGNTENANWTEKKVELNDITAGQKIERIGLRVKGSDADYNVLVGKLELNDDVTATPANVKDLTVQVKEEKKIRFLQKSDVMKLMTMRMNDRESELARLMFVFSCFTGLAISDMENLEYRHIQTAADGQRYIRKERQKTKVEFIVPLHPIAEAIISHRRKEQERSEEHLPVKEKGDNLVFHRVCNRSVMGKNLCIVGKAYGIRGRLSYHMARHTFGTITLSAGIPIESIAKMMGHASISSTQIYAQVTDNKISEDMDRLIAKYKTKDKNTANTDMEAAINTKTIPFVVKSNGRKEETA